MQMNRRRPPTSAQLYGDSVIAEAMQSSQTVILSTRRNSRPPPSDMVAQRDGGGRSVRATALSLNTNGGRPIDDISPSSESAHPSRPDNSPSISTIASAFNYRLYPPLSWPSSTPQRTIINDTGEKEPAVKHNRGVIERPRSPQDTAAAAVLTVAVDAAALDSSMTGSNKGNITSRHDIAHPSAEVTSSPLLASGSNALLRGPEQRGITSPSGVLHRVPPPLPEHLSSPAAAVSPSERHRAFSPVSSEMRPGQHLKTTVGLRCSPRIAQRQALREYASGPIPAVQQARPPAQSTRSADSRRHPLHPHSQARASTTSSSDALVLGDPHPSTHAKQTGSGTRRGLFHPEGVGPIDANPLPNRRESRISLTNTR